MSAKIENLKEIKKNQTGLGLLIENDGYISLSKEEHSNLVEAIHDNSTDWTIPNPFIVSAVFQKYGIENANGRIYPEDVLKKQVDLYQQLIQERRAYGELNHPDSSAIDGSNISHIITELHWEGHTLVGKLELQLSPGYVKYGIPSTAGDKVANLILSNYKIGVSSRGIGSVEHRLGKYIVSDDYELTCWDIVCQPSTPNAWIDKDEKSLQPYIESKTSEKNNILSEKLDKIEKLLL